MKLAEALLVRGDMQKKIASLRDRIVANAVVQEGDKPKEDPDKLLREVAGVIESLQHLVLQINEINMRSKLPDGRSMTAALAERDALVQRHSMLQAAVAGTRREPDRYGLREIKWVSMVDVSKLQKQSDDLSRRLRELTALIQEANWKIELEEPKKRK